MTTPLHWIGEFARDLTAAVPLPVVRAVFIAIPALLLVWVLLLKRDQVTPERPTGRFGENLKLGAAFALILQIVIYALL